MEQESLPSSEMNLRPECIPSPAPAGTNALDYLPSASRAPPRSNSAGCAGGAEKSHFFFIVERQKENRT